MRSAPAVQVQSDGGPLWQGLRWGLPAAAISALTAWSALHAGAGAVGAAWAAALMALATTLVLAKRWPAKAVLLQWDGQQWLVDGQPAQPQVMIDLGAWMLLRLQTQRQGRGQKPIKQAAQQQKTGSAQPVSMRWVAISAAQCEAANGPLRAAVYWSVDESTPAAR